MEKRLRLTANVSSKRYVLHIRMIRAHVHMESIRVIVEFIDNFYERLKTLVVQCYLIGVLKHLNVRRFLSVHFESVIPAYLAGVFLD